MADYFDLDAILAEEEKVSVHFNVGCTSLGRALDPSCDDDDLKSGSEVELPFWLVKDLASRGMVLLKLPKYFGQRVNNDLQADARCVNLGEKCKYYYEVGLLILATTHDQKLADFVMNTFEIRYQQLLINALSSRSGTKETNTVLRVLTSEERKVFDSGWESKKRFNQWVANPPLNLAGCKRRIPTQSRRVLAVRNQ
uniref:DNA replication complex GINS protein PSF3 n=1 Tax=Pyramimonas obovata TaxID=1411642 RepID=A0A7S0RJI9_9CHLO|mmetsp:Transcript_35636/g.77787  ORF Transcript_35636/g.77787 Transcript_35636/m.77787 type:complete len:197 (+) Transcript_35636:376-966(+)|eukprot:CAMPEP_0118942822 /NCGR_PEP_ID=MMETSP1169-20130426/36927_1 /TAXON_ID=36882 /ORGANISM="Pyramimonas obovata, Strain CCMP722" /LENGTH=196 /DNA_ID=CAMNT_0006887909 /DNA_START=339 /DNA_END=929 /DNA_ORIENTATION=+